MNNTLSFLMIILLTDSCEELFPRVIENNTAYGIEIINYESATTDGSDTLYIKPYDDFSFIDTGGESGFFSHPAFTPEQTDSLVLLFYKEGTDTVYRQRYKQYDTTALFKCLTGYTPITCFIEPRHLEGAQLIK